MGEEINLLHAYPRSKRPIDERAAQITESHRAEARRFGESFFDGDRLTGYGGFSYHPRFWTDTAAVFRDHYGLTAGSRVLDVGCAKGFMLHDLELAVPGIEVAGIDVSDYAIEHAMPEVAAHLRVGDAKDLPYDDDFFDLVISINTVHNLPLEECKQALREIERVSRGASFVTVDAWHNDDERRAMLAWNLTALTYMHVDEWKALFDEVGFTGDHWWFIAETA